MYNNVPNHHIRMISEGSCDTEDWSNGCWKFSFAITEINYILKYIKIERFSFFTLKIKRFDMHSLNLIVKKKSY